MKYFICDYARANWGKTSALKLVINKLGTPKLTEKSGDDVWALFEGVVTVSGTKRIVVSTVGDPYSVQPQWLQKAVDYEVDIVVCAARQHGKTVDNVYSILKDNGYKEIWFQNFHSDQLEHIAAMNNATADAIVQLIQQL